MFVKGSQQCAIVVTAGEFFRGRLKQGQLAGSGAGEPDPVDSDNDIGDGILERRELTIGPGTSLIFDMPGNTAFHQQGLENIGDLIGQAS